MGLRDWDYYYFSYDVRQLKRKHFDLKSSELKNSSSVFKKSLEDYGMGNGLADDDYKNFLMQICHNSKPSCSMREEDDKVSDDKDDEDPQYRMFLQNLKEDGKSYVVEVVKDNGMSVFMKYEPEDRLDDECKPHTRKRLRNVTGEGNIEAVKKLRCEPVNPVYHGTNGWSSQNLSPKSGSDDECGPQAREKPRNAKKGGMAEASNNLRNVLNNGKLENQIFFRNSQRKEMENLVIEKDLRSEPVNVVFSGTNKCSTQKLTPGDNNTDEPQRMFNMKNDMVDESYQLFLDTAKAEDDFLVFTIESSKVKYEADALESEYEADALESSSDSEIFMTDDPRVCNDGNYSPFFNLTGDDWKCLGNPCKKVPSHFREKVMAVLQKAYDQEEYENLLQDVEARNPVRGYRDTRTGKQSYSTNRCGKSCLDHYSDVKQKIAAVSYDRHKVLNILRGFFFWLQNLVHEGAFKPWQDPSCLAVIPASH